MLEDNQFYLGFNSTLVQLKVKTCNVFLLLLGEFQFYLSSIKRRKPEEMQHRQKTFQFYLSSIKSRYYLQHHQDGNTFQFYLSSIKSLATIKNRLADYKFQFYLSSIKRRNRRK